MEKTLEVKEPYITFNGTLGDMMDFRIRILGEGIVIRVNRVV